MVSLGLNGNLWVLFHECTVSFKQTKKQIYCARRQRDRTCLRETSNYSKQGANERLLLLLWCSRDIQGIKVCPTTPLLQNTVSQKASHVNISNDNFFLCAGPNAPKQVACGSYHSAILTVGGQVRCNVGFSPVITVIQSSFKASVRYHWFI